MAVLTDNQRAKLTAGLMRYWSASQTPIATTKANLRAAVNGIDSELDSSTTQFNNAVPQPARAELTADQKTLIVALTALLRCTNGEQLVRSLLDIA